MRASLATIFSISATPILILRFDFGKICCRAPTSSITSIALSGKRLSPICRCVNSAAEAKAAEENLTL